MSLFASFEKIEKIKNQVVKGEDSKAVEAIKEHIRKGKELNSDALKDSANLKAYLFEMRNAWSSLRLVIKAKREGASSAEILGPQVAATTHLGNAQAKIEHLESEIKLLRKKIKVLE